MRKKPPQLPLRGELLVIAAEVNVSIIRSLTPLCFVRDDNRCCYYFRRPKVAFFWNVLPAAVQGLCSVPVVLDFCLIQIAPPTGSIN